MVFKNARQRKAVMAKLTARDKIFINNSVNKFQKFPSGKPIPQHLRIKFKKDLIKVIKK